MNGPIADSRAASRWTYVIGSSGNRLVKIGTTTGSVEQRLANLQVGSPHRLHLILAVRTNARAERALHEYFAPRRCHGEWFDFGDLDPATEVCAAIGVIGTTPEVAKRRAVARPERTPAARYVTALLAAGAPAGVGRDRLKDWAKAHGVALPGKTETLAEITAQLKAASAR
ncbi:GIY-YIG nuclease family protein [Actinocrinis sp.]|uniref:GIY-YIG nuclease family protein n=1 Tax=Actinocrinis sp. TaxID=1920516 RepID=UPI002D23C352|nr:GIY-YIG nuclease family protein [Actinocrinis sp.]HZP54983.1 GIY-YIG nuclease family protein [Actinocrinis sp.]